MLGRRAMLDRRETPEQRALRGRRELKAIEGYKARRALLERQGSLGLLDHLALKACKVILGRWERRVRAGLKA